MKSSDPIWYEALQGDPIIVPTFTKELKTRIKTRALTLSFKKKSRLPALFKIGLGMLCLFGFILLAVNPSDPLKENSGQGKMTQPNIDSEWQQLINAKYPDFSNSILLKYSNPDGKMMIFNKRLYDSYGYRGITLGVDGFVKESNQWKWEQGVSNNVGNPQKEGNKDKLITAWFELGETPLFFGIVMDTQISQVQVSDKKNSKQTAQIIGNEDGYRYWFIALPEQYNLYTVEGLDAENKVISTQTYYYR